MKFLSYFDSFLADVNLNQTRLTFLDARVQAIASVPGGLRCRQILPDGGSAGRTEFTRYRGTRYVSAYIVKDGRLVANDRQIIVIR